MKVNKIIGLTGKLEILLINSAIGATPERVSSLGCPPKHSSDGMSYEDIKIKMYSCLVICIVPKHV